MIKDEEDFAKLVKASIKKDEEAFKSLIHLIEPEMYKIAKIKLKKEEYIYDAIQESIILIYKHIRKLKHIEYFRTWSMRILINECNKLYKKINKKTQDIITYDENIELKYESFEKVESEMNMDRLMSCLNENEKISIILFYKDEFTTKEISKILKESEGTIKSRIHRAKEKMKKYIEEEKIYE